MCRGGKETGGSAMVTEDAGEAEKKPEWRQGMSPRGRKEKE